jgi:RNA polymerase sigma-70 factor (ECF subfamily)
VSTGTDLLAAAFSQARPRPVRVAYAIIGSTARPRSSSRTAGSGWLPPIRTSPCAMWRPGRSWPCRGWRLTYCGPAADPADQVTLDDEVSYALLVVMETLSPAERTAGNDKLTTFPSRIKLQMRHSSQRKLNCRRVLGRN